MHTYKKLTLLLVISIFILLACNNNGEPDKVKNKSIISKGLYSYGPESKSFINCEDGSEYWVADSAKTLELAYNNLGFEKPYTPVYIEVECKLVKSDTSLTPAGNYDSTMVVTKLIKISKEIPPGPCNQ
jgi:copper homeostasis protein (lipoprotein)